MTTKQDIHELRIRLTIAMDGGEYLAPNSKALAKDIATLNYMYQQSLISAEIDEEYIQNNQDDFNLNERNEVSDGC